MQNDFDRFLWHERKYALLSKKIRFSDRYGRHPKLRHPSYDGSHHAGDISPTGRKWCERDSPEAQRDRNAGQRCVHDLRELESEHRPRIHPGSHAHLFQHQDLPGHQVNYKSRRHFKHFS